MKTWQVTSLPLLCAALICLTQALPADTCAQWPEASSHYLQCRSTYKEMSGPFAKDGQISGETISETLDKYCANVDKFSDCMRQWFEDCSENNQRKLARFLANTNYVCEGNSLRPAMRSRLAEIQSSLALGVLEGSVKPILDECILTTIDNMFVIGIDFLAAMDGETSKAVTLMDILITRATTCLYNHLRSSRSPDEAFLLTFVTAEGAFESESFGVNTTRIWLSLN